MKHHHLQAFQAKLDEALEFPCTYMFKFIVATEKRDELLVLFEGQEVALRPSSKGTYFSLTSEILVHSSDQIIAVYRKAGEIEGLRAL